MKCLWCAGHPELEEMDIWGEKKMVCPRCKREYFPPADEEADEA